MSFEGMYPVQAMKDGAAPVSATGNIFGEGPEPRAKLIADAAMPIFDVAEHSVLLILGCQGANSPEAQPVAVATAKLLESAGVSYGVLEEEMCWGEAMVHGGGLMEEWPFWKMDRIEQLDTALGGDRNRTILTICPHCRDNISTQYAVASAPFTTVRSHVEFLAELVAGGKLEIEKRAEEMAAHHPCKTIHNDEHGAMDALLEASGVKAYTAGKSPDIPRCCGGGGGGFLWDSPAKVNRNRWDALEATGQSKVVTACPGCHRMLGAARSAEGEITDIASVLYERVKANRAAKAASESEPEA